MSNRGLGVVNHAAELGEAIAEMMSRTDRQGDYWYTAGESCSAMRTLTPMAMSGVSICFDVDTTRFDEALRQCNERRGTWNAPAPELYRLAWECEDCGHRYYGDLPPMHCLGCQGSHYKPIKLRVQDVEQSDAGLYMGTSLSDGPKWRLDNFGIHRDLIPPEPEPQPLGWIVRG